MHILFINACLILKDKEVAFVFIVFNSLIQKEASVAQWLSHLSCKPEEISLQSGRRYFTPRFILHMTLAIWWDIKLQTYMEKI